MAFVSLVEDNVYQLSQVCILEDILDLLILGSIEIVWWVGVLLVVLLAVEFAGSEDQCFLDSKLEPG